jgi:hypothetical protein
MKNFEKTYKLVPSPPPPLQWDIYKKAAKAEWDSLLSSRHATDESKFQAFLERNPSFVLGAFSFPASGHYPIFGSLISKPPLTGVGIKVPDFMWLATATDTVYPVLVEIETPAKRWFTKAGQPDAKWTQARNQLIEWKQWLSDPDNKSVFLKSYRIPSYYHRHYIEPQFLLIYGRRFEFEERPELRGKRALQKNQNEFHVTFDRLEPDRNALSFLTIKKTGNGYTAITIPPTVLLGPHLAHHWQSIRGKEDAALKEDRMTNERRQFLAKRFEYWDDWARQNPGSYFIQAGDAE